ncbi:hypothetical protein HZH66_012602 [Vespula vulgaris]|uniref:Uncharacterized protein n=1 Tax=Vespula vulgaris TaxID=7454 RepID=A0A834JAC8_VESVU|nr:hypothetical protein HZH66_012602 [Vespula vulgaris]
MGREGVMVLASVNERTKSVLTRVSGDARGQEREERRVGGKGEEQGVVRVVQGKEEEGTGQRVSRLGTEIFVRARWRTGELPKPGELPGERCSTGVTEFKNNVQVKDSKCDRDRV